MKVKKSFATVSMLMIANFLIKIFGLLREILVAKYYGTSVYTDAYIIANNIPTVLFAALGSALATTFIPMYSKICERENEKRANTFTIHTITVIIGICFVLTMIGETFTGQIVSLFASGFQEDALSITIVFTKILFPSIFGMALMNLFGSYLQLHDKFLPIALVPMFGNLAIIFSLIIANRKENVFIFVWGTLAGLIVQILFYFPWVIKAGLLTGTVKGLFQDKYLAALLPLVVPVFLGEAVNEINSIVDKTLVSGLGTGSVSSLNYAYKIINLIMGVAVVSLVTLLYPKLSKLSAAGNIVKLKEKSEDSIALIVTLVFPIAVLVIFFRLDIVKMLFERGNFDGNSTSRTAVSLGCYAIGLVAMGIREILAKIFYSVQDTRTPMKNGVICALSNILLDIILIHFLGYKGAALATAIVAWISAGNLLRISNKRGLIRIRKIVMICIKCLLAGSFLYGFLVLWKLVVIQQFTYGIVYLLMCLAGCCIGMCIYMLVHFMMKNNILKYIGD